jgi:monoamine oxidase
MNCQLNQKDTMMMDSDGTSPSSRPAPNEVEGQREPNDVWDVIILGAGQAGMAAAHRLIFEQPDGKGYERKLRLLILEASDHVGGRTRNYDVSTGEYDVISDNVIEMGGTWLSPDHTAALELCRQHLGLEVFRSSFQPEPKQHMMRKLDCIEGIDTQEKSRSDDSAEFPWWFLGPDYSDEEMGRLQRIVVHQVCNGEVNQTKTVAVSNPEDFLQSFSTETVQQLEEVGQIIQKDMAKMVDTPGSSENAWEHPTIGRHWHELDSGSTAKERNFLVSNDINSLLPVLTDPNARNILRGVIHDKNAEDPDRVSYLYNLISWKGSNSKGPDMEFRVRGGTQAIALAIAKKLAGEGHSHQVKIKLESPVKSIQRVSIFDDDVHSDPLLLVTTMTGEQFRSKTVLVTGSPASLRNIQFGSDTSALLPKVQRDLLSPESSPMGRCMKFCAIYNRGPWWRDFGLQGDILSSGLPEELSVEIDSSGREGKDSLPIFSYCYDISTYSRKYGVLCCFVEGAAYDKFQRMNMEGRRKITGEFLRLSFEKFINGTDTTEPNRPLWEPDDFACFEWGPQTTYIGGAYTSYFPPRILSRLGNWQGYKQIEKATNVFWAGADYYAGFGNGYMEGAIRGGQRSADLISERLASIDV